MASTCCVQHVAAKAYSAAAFRGHKSTDTQAIAYSASSVSQRSEAARLPGFKSQSSSLTALQGRFQHGLRSNKRQLLRFRGSRGLPVVMQATATKTAFHIGETTITVPLTADVARELNDGLSSILQTFKEKEQATRPKRWQSLDWKHKGDLAAGGVDLEVFCNPNAYGNAFQAKVLITVKDDRMQVTSEGQLSALKADITNFLESQ